MCHDGVESTVLSVSDNDIEVFFLLLLLLLIAIDIIRAQPISSAVNVYTRSISIILWNPFYFRTFFYQWNEKYLQICWHVVILFHICHYMLFVDLWHTEFPIDTSKFEAHTNKTLFARRSVSSVFRMCIHITYAQGNLTSTSLIPIRCLQSNIWLWLKIEENAEFTSTYAHTHIHSYTVYINDVFYLHSFISEMTFIPMKLTATGVSFFFCSCHVCGTRTRGYNIDERFASCFGNMCREILLYFLCLRAHCQIVKGIISIFSIQKTFWWVYTRKGNVCIVYYTHVW